MNLRELQQHKRAVMVDGIVKESRPVGCASPSWLACYPNFQDALRGGETSFRALPHFAKLPVLKRTATNTEAQAVFTSVTLNEVRAAYVELSTTCVVEAVESYLSVGMHSENLQSIRSSILDTIAAQFPHATVPQVARPPCLLSPGKGIFLDGWQRFFTYLSRDDKTIPLLAVDWPVFYERLAGNSPEDGRAATNLPR
ncbi:hypothetical protein P0D71_11295 [Paraburkholderia sp. RL17-383-BIF-A]|uniref:hypothetical protein n=1 Tax=Paraburkholderia sp. RL17-383-BIF-A TaxID=3031631 RepID=UPI0038BCA019